MAIGSDGNGSSDGGRPEGGGAERFWQRYGEGSAGGGQPEGGGGAQRFWQRYGEVGRGVRGAGAAAGAEGGEAHRCLEWCPICRGADFLRQAAGPDFDAHLHAAARDLVQLLRTLAEAHASREQDPASGEEDRASHE